MIVGLVASPGSAADLARQVVGQLPDVLAGGSPDAAWTIRVRVDRLVERPAGLSELIDAARRRMLQEGWQLTVCLTDLPLQRSRRPVVAHASASHSVAVLSVPALGPVAVTDRALETIGRLVTALLAGNDEDTARQLGGPVEADHGGIGLVAGVVTGNLRLLLGMLRANRPWRMTIGLSRALVAAITAGVFALVTSDIWRLAVQYSRARLALLSIGAVLAVVVTIIVGASLWERVPPGPARGSPAAQQVVLFNLVTVLTVVVGVLALYVALLVLALGGVLLLVPETGLDNALGRPARSDDFLAIAWLASSVATIGGALGAGLESDESVREAAYSYQPDEIIDERRA
ncbi:hypothetical protein [Dactylosporangium matsuzakiense]|uniref:Uncharacterized protein n=1 Tax=Dactylosporangium matsuzakiense TaxID=53360 RepID=A0A9W6KEP9_9ACTN|nr:hypothetical protein [Dactylosporangium matsuzakiense]GLK99279.1 hypothetical protein GCM10017581_010200 [Dactylosporangium matsuzakiense]